jgi:hypothetical protein
LISLKFSTNTKEGTTRMWAPMAFGGLVFAVT